MPITALRSVPQEPASASIQMLGTVVEVLVDNVYRIDCDGSTWQCRRAASCLLRPELGDTVLISGPDRYRVYLLAVIEQADASTACIDARGDLKLSTGQGRLDIESAQGVRVKSDAGLALEAQDLALHAATGECRIASLSYVGSAVQAAIGHVKLVGNLYEAVLDRLVHVSRTAFRLVEKTDLVRVGHLDIQAEEMARIHAPQTLITGKKVVKVDAAQIHIG